jgi:hypothetical protein
VPRLSRVEAEARELALRVRSQYWFQRRRVFDFDVVGPAEEDELGGGLAHQFLEPIVGVDLLAVRLHQLLVLVEAEVLDSFVGNLRVAEAQFVGPEELHERTDAFLVLLGLAQVRLPFRLQPLD